jgi:nucleoside phosphorylase
VCALREELGGLERLVRSRRRQAGTRGAIEWAEIELASGPLLACVAGVGPERARAAATALAGAAELEGLLVVGVCGGLRPHLVPGELVHCTRAVSVSGGASRDADAALRSAWSAVAPGFEGSFLTCDRPVLDSGERRRLCEGLERSDPAVVDMETAAVAEAASRAGLRWAALRAVTDRADGWGRIAFRLHYPSQAGRAADTVPTLLASLSPRGRP